MMAQERTVWRTVFFHMVSLCAHDIVHTYIHKRVRFQVLVTWRRRHRSRGGMQLEKRGRKRKEGGKQKHRG